MVVNFYAFLAKNSPFGWLAPLNNYFYSRLIINLYQKHYLLP